jgi:cell division transport system permease protein
VSEASTSLLRDWRSSLPVLLAITAAVGILGLFLLASTTANRAIEAWSAAAEMSVFLDEGITVAQRRALERELDESAVVAGRSYLDTEAAARRFASEFPELAAAAASLGRSPFPASYEVRLRMGPGAEPTARLLSTRLATFPGVLEVRYEQGLIDRLSALVSAGRRLGASIALVLIFVAIVAVASVVRLSYSTRRSEVEVLYLVGAPIAAIRGPFVAEGWLQGTVGAIVALAMLGVAFALFGARYGDAVASGLGVDRVPFLPPWTCVAIVVVSGLVGAVAALVAVTGSRASAE